jgi:hypothetical protein
MIDVLASCGADLTRTKSFTGTIFKIDLQQFVLKYRVPGIKKTSEENLHLYKAFNLSQMNVNSLKVYA